jgi:protein-tyrosine phosphatase
VRRVTISNAESGTGFTAEVSAGITSGANAGSSAESTPEADAGATARADAPNRGADRRLRLTGTFNVRDVGGYRTNDGGVIRFGVFLRGDALHRLDDEARAHLTGLPLRTVVDLREDFEVRRCPDALDGTGVTVLRMPVFKFTGDSFGKAPDDLATLYSHMVDACGPALVEAVAALAEPGALPALVHCSAGKDRTGLVTAIVLAVAGVPDEVIAEDYALTSAYLATEFTHAVEQLKASTGLGQRLNEGALACPPELILAALARMRSGHGSIEGYALAHGMSPERLAALKEALVERLAAAQTDEDAAVRTDRDIVIAAAVIGDAVVTETGTAG